MFGVLNPHVATLVVVAILISLLVVGYTQAQVPPAAPTIDSVAPGDSVLTVEWTAPSGTTGIAAYDVRHIETSGDEGVDANWTVIEGAWSSGDLQYTIGGLANGTQYDVQVRATGGAWSATTSATPADHGGTRNTATDIGENDVVRGSVSSSEDVDYFRLTVSSAAIFWIYTTGDLDTRGELQDNEGYDVETNYRGGVSPNLDNFFIWRELETGTHYIKVTGFGAAHSPYGLVVRSFADTTSRSDAATLEINGSSQGTISPEDDEDYFKLVLSETTEVAIWASGSLLSDSEGELQDSDGMVVASNNDGHLPGEGRHFLFRRSLSAGTHYVKVSSHDETEEGPYGIHATEISEPGSTLGTAQALTMGAVAGGNIDPAGDEDYFSLTLEATTYLTIGGAGANLTGQLLDSDNMELATHTGDRFAFRVRLEAGTYYLKVKGESDTDTGRYTVRAAEDRIYSYLSRLCSGFTRSPGINDPLYGCQWHLDNNDQYRDSAGHDINVEEVWSTHMGEGINVAVVDDGMHYEHEDLRDNVDTTLNHNYGGESDIYNPGLNHGTSVAGVVAARDNSLGVRGVAPRATIYGYNLLEAPSDANRANAMSRNSGVTAVSNHSYGQGNTGVPQLETALWEMAVEKGVRDGYGGKGVFYVFAAGNGFGLDYSNLSEATSFYAVTTACAVGYDDKRSNYSELGPNLWVCAPSDSERPGVPDITTTNNGSLYWDGFGGTSTAAPIVSGVAALIRQADNNLTWRDVKLILANSARKNHAGDTGWEQGAQKYGSTTDRYDFNHQYGFGVVNAKAAIDLVADWTKLPALRETTVESGTINLSIPDNVDEATSTTLKLDHYVDFIEFVEIDIDFDHESFRDLRMELVSPAGTVSVLTIPTSFGQILSPLKLRFRLGSARHLGENAVGEWTLRASDHYETLTGKIKSWSLTAYGHGTSPEAPEISTVTAGGGTLTVEWNASEGTGPVAPTSYELRYIRKDATDKSDDQWTLVTGVGTLTDRSYKITGLQGGVDYEVQVRGRNATGPGPWSDVESGQPTTVVPSAPSITAVARGNATLTVQWSASENTGGAAITAYDVRHILTSGDETDDANWTVVDDAWTSGDLKYIITSLTNASQYDVQVRGVNSAGDGLWSGTKTGIPYDGHVPVNMAWDDAAVEAAENSGSVTLRALFTTTVNVPPASNFTFGINVNTADAHATSGSDYTSLSSSATFGAGDFAQVTVAGQQRYRVTKDFTITILDNAVYEPDEDFGVTLAYQTTASHLQGGPARAVVTIEDNEPVPVTIGWEQTNVTVDEDGGMATLRALATTTADERPADGFSFDARVYTLDNSAVQPGDYTRVNETVTFQNSDFEQATVDGQSRYRAAKPIEVTIRDDAVDEIEEDFGVTLEYVNSSPPYLQGGASTATVTIDDDEHVPVTIGWDESHITVAEDAGTLTLLALATTTTDKRPEEGFSFDASVRTSDGTAVQPGDYTRVSETLTFARGDFSRTTVGGQGRYRASKQVQVAIGDDTTNEHRENFTLTFEYSDPGPLHLQGGADTATITITDNDGVPIVLKWEQSELSVGENTAALTLVGQAVTTENAAPEEDVSFGVRATTMSGTAREGADFERLNSTAIIHRNNFEQTLVDGQMRFLAERRFTIAILSDTQVEDDEDFSVTLRYTTSELPYLTGGPATATVTIIDGSGEEPPRVPLAPIGLTALPLDGGIHFGWNVPPNEDSRAPVLSYTVGYRPEASDQWTDIEVDSQPLGVPEQYVEITGLTNNTHYALRVAAVNRLGTGEYAEAAGTPQGKAEPPPPPPDDPDDPEPVEVPELNVGALGAYWTDGYGSDALHPDARLNTLWNNCDGTKSFKVYWVGPEEHEAVVDNNIADEYEAHVTTRGGVGQVTHRFDYEYGGNRYYGMYGKVSLRGDGSLSIRIRGRYSAHEWGTWSKPVTINCWTRD